ncbi:glycosyltransferase family 39 protein [Marinibacterium sp. SX1]|uniref:glycosyltransferase family 39 protein n=1 Tax=Marinibacterium sp. SX1 TaxID=3388424 RepID=UPI003D1663D8
MTSMTQHIDIAGSHDRDDRLARMVPAAVLVYLAVQCAARVAAPGGLTIDEAEQMVATQALEWGYSTQPPLYTWIQMAVFEATGPGKLGLAAVKAGLLASTYLGVWTLMRQLRAGPTLAAVAVVGALLLPSLSYEAQKDLTHSVLATALAVWTTCLAVAALRRPTMPGFAALGLLIGAGLLAKWNFAILLIGLIPAIALDPRARGHLGGWLLCAAVALAVIALPAGWILSNWAVSTSGASKFAITQAPYLQRVVQAAGEYGMALLSACGLLVLAFLAGFDLRAARKAAGDETDADRALLQRCVILAIAATGLLTIALGATEVRERWLLPVLVLVPAALALWLGAGLTARRFHLFLGLGAALMLALAVALPLNMARGGRNPAHAAIPFDRAAEAMELNDQLVLVSDRMIAGNLRNVRPDLAVVTPDMPGLLAGRPADFAIWGARDDRPADLPAPLPALVSARGDQADFAQHSVVTLPYPAPHQDRNYSFYRVEVAQ